MDPQTGIRAPSARPYDPEWVSDTPGLLALNYPKGMGAQAQNLSKMIRFGTRAPPGFAGVLLHHARISNSHAIDKFAVLREGVLMWPRFSRAHLE